MLIDSQVSFVPIGGPLSLVGGAGVNIPSPLVVDLMGVGVGVAPPNIIGRATVFGTDMGIGVKKPQIIVSLGTALATATAATLNIAIQGAPDQGLAGNYQPGTWQTLDETGPITAAQGTANTVVARMDYPPAFPVNTLPRYIRLLFQIPAATSFTAGTVSSAIVTMDPDEQANKYAAGNFTV